MEQQRQQQQQENCEREGDHILLPGGQSTLPSSSIHKEEEHDQDEEQKSWDDVRLSIFPLPPTTPARKLTPEFTATEALDMFGFMDEETDQATGEFSGHRRVTCRGGLREDVGSHDSPLVPLAGPSTPNPPLPAENRLIERNDDGNVLVSASSTSTSAPLRYSSEDVLSLLRNSTTSLPPFYPTLPVSVSSFTSKIQCEHEKSATPPPLPLSSSKRRPSTRQPDRPRIPEHHEDGEPTDFLSATPPPIGMRSNQHPPRPVTPRQDTLSPFPLSSLSTITLKTPQRQYLFSTTPISEQRELTKVEEGSVELWDLPPLPLSSTLLPQIPLNAPQPQLSFGSSAPVERSETRREKEEAELFSPYFPVPLSVSNSNSFRTRAPPLLTMHEPTSQVAEGVMSEIDMELRDTHSQLMEALYHSTAIRDVKEKEGAEFGTRKLRRHALARRDDGKIGLQAKQDMEEEDGKSETDTDLADDMAAFFAELLVEEESVEVGSADVKPGTKSQNKPKPILLEPTPKMRAKHIPAVPVRGSDGEVLFSKPRPKVRSREMHMRGGAGERPVSTGSVDSSVRSWNGYSWSEDDRLSEFTFTSDGGELSPTRSERAVRGVTPLPGARSRQARSLQYVTDNEIEDEGPYADSSTTPQYSYGRRYEQDDGGYGSSIDPPRLRSPFESPHPPPFPTKGTLEAGYRPNDQGWMLKSASGDQYNTSSKLAFPSDEAPADNERKKKLHLSPAPSQEVQSHGTISGDDSQQHVPYRSATVRSRSPLGTRNLEPDPSSSTTPNLNGRSQPSSVCIPSSLDTLVRLPSRSNGRPHRSRTGKKLFGHHRTASSGTESTKTSHASSASAKWNHGDDSLCSTLGNLGVGKTVGVVDAPLYPNPLQPYHRSRGSEQQDNTFLGLDQGVSAATRDRSSMLTLQPDDSISMVDRVTTRRQPAGRLRAPLHTLGEEHEMHDDATDKWFRKSKQELITKYQQSNETLRHIDNDPRTSPAEKRGLRKKEEAARARFYLEIANKTGSSEVDEDRQNDLRNELESLIQPERHHLTDDQFNEPTTRAAIPAPPVAKPRKSSLQKIGRLLRWTVAVPDNPNLKSYSQRRPPGFTTTTTTNAVRVDISSAGGPLGQGGSVTAALAALKANPGAGLKTYPSSQKSAASLAFSRRSSARRKESSEASQNQHQRSAPGTALSTNTAAANTLPLSLRVGAQPSHATFAHDESMFVGSPLVAEFGKEGVGNGQEDKCSPAYSWDTAFPTMSRAGG